MLSRERGSTKHGDLPPLGLGRRLDAVRSFLDSFVVGGRAENVLSVRLFVPRFSGGLQSSGIVRDTEGFTDMGRDTVSTRTFPLESFRLIYARSESQNRVYRWRDFGCVRRYRKRGFVREPGLFYGRVVNVNIKHVLSTDTRFVTRQGITLLLYELLHII